MRGRTGHASRIAINERAYRTIVQRRLIDTPTGVYAALSASVVTELYTDRVDKPCLLYTRTVLVSIPMPLPRGMSIYRLQALYVHLSSSAANHTIHV